ncbi:MAG: hypothetical protein IID32_00445 [Planctomycetes bacterium]|nr:hypothetical protein [Planctomycetota bacterium]
MFYKLYVQDQGTSSKVKSPPPEKSDALPSATWPVRHERHRVLWYPARHRLIGLVRTSPDSHILPPAMIRKTTWRE